jgi:transmembrane sensor
MDTIGGPSGRGNRISAADLERIERYLAGALTPADEDEFLRWIRVNPGHRRLVDALTEIWAGDGPSAPAFDVTAMWMRALPRVRERPRILSIIRRDTRRSPGHGIWARLPAAAAAAFLLAAIGVTGWIVRDRRRPHAAPAVAMREFSTRRGQRADLQLDDGTQVVLGAATTVRIPDGYGDRTRDVYLDGEAYFVVRHDVMHPFVVHAGRALVRDVGTRFAVTAYGAAPPARVVVAEGEVRVAHVELRQNDLAVIDSSGQSAAVEHGVDASTAVGWTRGQLAFEAVPFRDVAASLGRWYDLDIQLAEPALGRQPLTVTFGTESTHQVLDALALLTHTRYEQRGRTATFYALSGS